MLNIACHFKQSSKTSFRGTLSWRWRGWKSGVRLVPTATTRILGRRSPGTCETLGQVFKFVWRLRWKINVVCMSLSPFVSFQSRFVTYLLTFSRTCLAEMLSRYNEQAMDWTSQKSLIHESKKIIISRDFRTALKLTQLPMQRVRRAGRKAGQSPSSSAELRNAWIHRMSQEECARLREGVSYVKVYRYNPKHLCPKLNGYRDNGKRKVWSSGGSTHCTRQLTALSMLPRWVWCHMMVIQFTLAINCIFTSFMVMT